MRFVFLAVLFATAACQTTDEPTRGGVGGKADGDTGSCQASCGEQSQTGTCWCDAQCIEFGDCCSDKGAVCDAKWQDTNLAHGTEHATLLSTGKVLLWGVKASSPALFDPTSATLRHIPANSGAVNYNSANVTLPDGRVLMVGGGFMHTTARVFDPVAPAGVSPWSTLGGNLTTPRFYPTALLLGSGQVLIGSGDFLTGPPAERTASPGAPAELYDPAQNRWVPIVDRSQANERLPSFDTFPATFQLPSGNLVYLPNADEFTRRVNPSAILALDGPRVTSDNFGAVKVNGVVVEAPSTTKGWEQLPIVLPRRLRGGSVMLIDDTGDTPIARILLVGGESADLVDFTNERNPTTVSSRLELHRGLHPGVVALPTGAVLVFDAHELSPQAPEIFENGTWSIAGPRAKYARAWHGTAVLVPDGRVVLNSDAPDRRIEMFSPAYLAHARPTIRNAPAVATAGSTITIEASTDRIASVSLVRTASITHGTDVNQRYVKLRTSAVGSTRGVRIPAANTAPPGVYLLHVVDDRGIPSPGRFIRLQ